MSLQYYEPEHPTLKLKLGNIRRRIYYGLKENHYKYKAPDTYRNQRNKIDKNYQELSKLIKLQHFQVKNNEKSIQFQKTSPTYIPLFRPLLPTPVLTLPKLKKSNLKPTKHQKSKSIQPASPFLAMLTP